LNRTVQAAAISISLIWGSLVLGGSVSVANAQQPPAAPKKVLVAATGADKAPVAAQAKIASDKSVAPKSPAKKKKSKPEPVPQMMSDVADWVSASGDNRGLPFAVIDKAKAQIIVYGVDGKRLGRAPVLIGSSVGDGSAPGVGDRELSDIPMDERTTPAGRYLVGFGPAAGHSKVLWVDYVNSISIHAIPATKISAKEKRTQRLTSKTVDDNRITHGCINVSPVFYSRTIATTFRKGGVFYVLPDTETLQQAIPAFGLNSVEAIAALGAAAPVVPIDREDGALSSDEGSAPDAATPVQ
jgi:hypothetical protein